MAFRGKSGSSLWRDSASPTSAAWSCQTPTAWKVPLTESQGVFHADRQSGGGSGAPLSWERLWGGRVVSHPRLCTGLCQLGLCVAVTQIAVGEPGLEMLSTGSCSSSDGSGASGFQWLVGLQGERDRVRAKEHFYAGPRSSAQAL